MIFNDFYTCNLIRQAESFQATHRSSTYLLKTVWM